MKIKVYRGCAVDGHNGIYTPMVFAERYPEFVSPDVLPVLLAGPDHEDYADVSADDFINNSDTQVYEYNDSGDILEYELIDSDKITLKELNKYSTSENFGSCIPVYECDYGYADIAQIGVNCLCRVSLANVGIVGADCFFEMDDWNSFDENLLAFFDELKETLKKEFQEDRDIFILPAFYAPALINADSSGLTNAEEKLLNDFINKNTTDICSGCSDNTFFTKYHDLPGVGACDCKEFYFGRKADDL